MLLFQVHEKELLLKQWPNEPVQPLEHLQRLPLTPHVYMACMSRQYNEVLSRLRELQMEVQQRTGIFYCNKHSVTEQNQESD